MTFLICYQHYSLIRINRAKEQSEQRVTHGYYEDEENNSEKPKLSISIKCA